MTLLDTLATELMGPKSTKELSKGVDASSEQVQQAVAAALPLMLSGMHQNSTSEEGAKSLEKALNQHAPDAEKSTSSMLKKVDVKDGEKIVSHILGENETAVTEGLSRATGLSNGQTLKLLAMLAPVLLSLVGKEQQNQQTQQVQQLQQIQPAQQTASGGLTQLLGGALLGNSYQQIQPAQQNSLNVANLAGALLGGGSTANTAPAVSSGGSLLGSLLSGSTSNSTASSGGSLLGSLFGGGSSASQQQQQQSGGLSSLLMGLLK